MPKPTIILAFADYRTDRQQHLRELDEEQYGILQALRPAVKAGLCTLETIPGANARKIAAAFQEAAGPVVAFHFAGHADGYGLMIDDGAPREGLAAFLGKQQDLRLVFLNACATQGHVGELHRAGVPLVIATSSAILDRVARDLAVSFYEQLSKGKSLQSAFSAYESRHLLSQTPYDELIREDARGLQLRAQEPFPWKMHVRAGAEAVLDWTLAVEAGNPLFGLPPLPQRYHLPADPFRGLERFQREHAAVFFGRGKEIRMLYDKISNAQLNPVILLYGQSGVGKSSLLEAGLIPRLEDQFRVRSLRRDPEEGISTGFRALLDPQSEHASLRDSWQAQSTGRKPLVVVLDQVEEIFTRPVSGDERELQSLVGQLRDLFDGSSPALPGKLLLSYRKEYHPEIEAALREAGVPFTKVFLDKIRKPGIVEAVTGLTHKPRLVEQYQLSVEDGLAAIIADDLEDDEASAIAPVLQILLQKMWQEATQTGAPPAFTIQQYRHLKRRGILLSHFLQEKLEELGRWNREVIDSGLVIDLLMFHTTAHSTSNQRRISEIRERYEHRLDVLENLLQEFRAKYLLVDVPNQQEAGEDALSLAHDILAPLIRKEFEVSDKPGQMAARILANRVREWRGKDEEKPLLDETSLEIVEKGRPGMRIWLVDEAELVRESQEHVAALRRQRRNARIGLGLASVFVLVFAALFFLQRKQTAERALAARADRLAVSGQTLRPVDPTQALDSLYQGWQLQPDDGLKAHLLYQTFRENLFYELLHREPSAFLNRVAFSAAGDLAVLATDAPDRKLPLLELATDSSRVITRLEGPDNPSFALTFSPDDRFVLAGSTDTRGYLWERQPSPTALLRHLPDTAAIQAVAFAQTGSELATGHGDPLNALQVWTPDGRFLRKVPAGAAVTALTYGASDRQLFAGLQDGRILVASSEEQTAYLNWARSAVTKTQWSTEGRYLLTATAGEAACWTWSDGRLQLLFELGGHPAPIRSAALAPDGRLIFLGYADGQGRIFSAADGRLLREVRGHTGAIHSASFTRDLKFLLTASEDGSIRRWALPYDLPWQRWEARDLIPTAIAVGSQIWIGTDLGAIYEYRPEGPVLVAEAQGEAITALALSADGLLISGDQAGVVRAWDLSSRPAGKRAEASLHEGRINRLAATPDGRLILSASDDGTVGLWNPATKEQMKLEGHRREVKGLAIDSSGNFAVSSGLDSLAILWKLPEGRRERVFEHPETDVLCATFSADGRSILTGTQAGTRSGQLRTWSLTGKLQRSLKINGPVYDLAVDPEDRFVVLSSADYTLEVRQADGHLLRTFQTSRPGERALPFSRVWLLAAEGQALGLVERQGLYWWRNDRTSLPTFLGR